MMVTFVASVRVRLASVHPTAHHWRCGGPARAGWLPVVAAFALTAFGGACAAREGGVARPGAPCGSGPVGNLLTPRWQQCWLTAAGGRWRTLHHDLHYDSFVVDAEADNLEDAREIAQLFIANQPRFRYLTLYVHKTPAATPGPVRRVSWSASAGFELLDYDLAEP